MDCRKLITTEELASEAALKATDEFGFSFGSMSNKTSEGVLHTQFYRAMKVEFGNRSIVIVDTFTLESQSKLFEVWLKDTPDLARIVSSSMKAAGFTLNRGAPYGSLLYLQ